MMTKTTPEKQKQMIDRFIDLVRLLKTAERNQQNNSKKGGQSNGKK
jgi:hypothetical protein